jgi:hypothetical protein
MNSPVSLPVASGLSVEYLFQEIYRILEGIQDSKEKVGVIAAHIARCQHELLSLDKAHSNRWRFHSRNSREDPFQIRDTLNKFVISCNALTYVNAPFAEYGADFPDGCLAFPTRRSWKKKQFKTLEAEFFGHERALALALTNAV